MYAEAQLGSFMGNLVLRRRIIRFAILAFAILIVSAPVPRAQAASPHEITVTNIITIKRGQKWSPKFWFGNQDEPLPPADYRPNDKRRVSKWYHRNPTHNLNFY